MFDPRASARLLQDPYRVYRVMRRKTPVAHLPEVGVWAVFRYADVRALVSGSHVSNDRSLLDPARVHPLGEQARKLMQCLDRHMLLSEGGVHTRRRAAVARAFSPRVVATFQGNIERLVDDLLDDVAARGDFDLMNHFARHLPVHVIAQIIGLPPADWEAFKRWTDGLIALNDPTKSIEERIAAASVMPAMKAYFDEMFALRRREPRDDLMTGLVFAQEGEHLDAEEMVATCSLLLAAGHETVMHTIGNSIVTLEHFVEARERLRAQPELWPLAVEELLRHSGPAQFLHRHAVRDCEIAGVRVPEGAMVMPGFASANRDEACFERPEELILDRHPNPHMAFGFGRHHCIGASLARLELRIAFARFFERFPRYEVDLASLVRRNSVWMRGVEQLRMRTGHTQHARSL